MKKLGKSILIVAALVLFGQIQIQAQNDIRTLSPFDELSVIGNVTPSVDR